MKAKMFLALVIALVCSVGLSLWLLKQDSTSYSASEPLLENATELLASLDAVSIENSEGVVFSAVLTNGAEPQWLATHLDSDLRFPVEREALVSLVSALNQAVKLEAKTNRPENHQRLGLDNVTNGDSRAHAVSLSGTSGQRTLLVGDDASSGLGSFVRFDNETQTWLIDQVIALPQDSGSWLKNPALSVSLDNVLRVQRVSDEVDEQWAVSKTPDQQWQLENRQHPLKYPSIVSNLVGNMLEAQFDTAVPHMAVDLPKAASILLQVVLADPSGEALQIEVFDMPETRYVRYTSPSQAWLSDWVFEISSFTYGQFDKVRADFVEMPDLSPDGEDDNESEDINESDSP
ncbi:DUF4340 domain-containing protein [Alteromonas oceanisediminis]|uniref:DUF4340 domain-containing protein n=1 Tax=Alteromonas oceanisediminis TaxID=2836180 RepID=UPI001BDA99EB|nr:DUF4340 domain-containing protein [Alteromonas oceanisediminis]MBT0585756.1 DUF4340 domain-containing protein [Alteromonas oceanisediminis]